MFRFLSRRIASYLLLLFLATSLAYLIASVALDPRAIIDVTNPGLNVEAIELTLTRYNINPDVNIFVRYGRWLNAVVTEWDWGFTPRGERVNDLVSVRAMVSVRLVTLGTFVGIIVGAGWNDRRPTQLQLDASAPRSR